MQSDGNLVIYRNAGTPYQAAVWSTGTNGKGRPPYRLTMQDDGNLCIYDGGDNWLWGTGTDSH